MIYTCFKTNLGWIGLAGTESGLRKSTLPCETEQQAIQSIVNLETNIRDDSAFSPAQNLLTRYFAGERVGFPLELDLSCYTDFQVKVWEVTQTTPYGECRTYAWIAEQIGIKRAARAVGNALGANPLPVIIPCHRVIRSDGKLGGFSAGLEWKIRLLKGEQRGEFAFCSVYIN